MCAKSYSHFTDSFSSYDIYKGFLAYGMFAEKIPPFLTSEIFYNYTIANPRSYSAKPQQYVYYENMRNINIPRPFGIPTPFSYQSLCKCISDNWSNIQEHFRNQTNGQEYKISRIHIRKLKDKDEVFEMNYTNWELDGTPEPDLLIGKKFVVKADISNCFPSIYTHSLPWALVGKEIAKSNRNKSEWFNQIDFCVQNTKHGETHGLLIGPHTSNLLSEIILTVIDKKLYDKGWRYIRNVDDYTCYVETCEDVEYFLADLQKELREFDLSINHKKTQIMELPEAAVEQWVRKINTISLDTAYGKVDFKHARAYMDFAIELMKENKGNSSVLKYAIKVLKGKDLTDNATKYTIKTIFHLAILYPYLIPILEDYVFIPYSILNDEVVKFSQKIYEDGLKKRNFEETSYALYYAIKYDFTLNNIKEEDAINSSDCIFLLLMYLYCNKHGDTPKVKELKNHARMLNRDESDMNKFWLFVYEVLPKSDLKDVWKALKNDRVSFIKTGFIS